MKRIILVFCSAFLCLSSCFAFTALAAEAENGGVKEPSNVTITVVIPEQTPKPAEEPTESAFIKVYPSDVTELRDGGTWEIIKTYELNAYEKPEDIPRGSFERSAGASGAKWRFTLTDIIRKETANAETREHTETVTLNTDTKELEKILPLLAPTMEYKAEDGFVGILSLDVASIKVETAGTKTSSYTMSVTREYPRLSSNDTSLIPKTVEDKGKTYTLAGVDWRAGNTVTVDYDALPEYYTAIATYTATGTSTKVTGYITTAVYTGALAKLSQGKTVYTAYFLGEEIRTPLEMVTPEAAIEPSDEAETTDETATPAEAPQDNSENKNSGSGVLLVIIPVLAALAGGAYYIFRKRKGQPQNEKTDDTTAHSDDDSGDGDSGIGG